MVKDAELEPINEKEKKLLHFHEQIENESDVKDDDAQECSLDDNGSKSEKDEGVEETNNDTNNLISDLLKEIDRLKEESKEKDRAIQTLQQKIAELERDHVPYEDAAEQMFDYETEVRMVHVEKGILHEEIVQKEVEIGGLYVCNDLLEEKLEKSEKDKASFEDGLDDMVTHMVTQEYHDNEEDKEKMQEEEQSKEGEVDQTISERVEIATGLHDEILSDEVIDKTISQIFKDTQEGERKKEKKRKREQDDIDPSSMVKDLKGKDDRTVKMEEGLIYYKKNQKERKKSNSAFEMTKLFNYISEEDMDLLDTIYEFEKEDKKAFIWHNPVNNDTVTIEDVLNLLNEGDIGNTCIDGLTYILERQEEKTAKTQGNCFYITSTCWTLIKEKADARTNLINEKLKELDKVIDINGVAFYKYLIFPMNSMGGRKVKAPDHWTLLIYDTSKQQWMHYNSLMKPKKKKDPYLTDASISIPQS
ncbi:stress response protein NST1-like [Rhododendron vialii]|uniref:stress response protein NST1-like n=1 Tax=Rhododendron vialii TaxID=182163 RepID=UPI00265E8798|nr:stress response protein NST1-like [Rhododendron vialii]